MKIRTIVALSLIGLSLASCGRAPEKVAAPLEFTDSRLPASRWDHRPEGDAWTIATLQALDTHGAALVTTVPDDIDRYCPAYRNAGPAVRKAFWVNLIAALARHESTFRPKVSGGNGRWHGLLQISPATARGYGCAAESESGLKNGALNLACGIRIMTSTVTRDGVISRGMRGVAADWGPFHQASKREDIQAWTSSLSYCRT